MNEYSLRTLTLDDYAAVFALWSQTEGMGLGASDTREAIALFLQRNPNLSWVATQSNGQIIGAVLCGHDGRRGYLHHLAVAKSHREQGIGRAIVNRCLEQLTALKLEKCNLFLFADNGSGRTFWLRQGWTAREDVVLVQKDLKPSKSCSCSC